MLEEQYIYANYNGYQYQNVNHHMDIPWHFNHPFKASLRSAATSC